jgi:tetratricopeptide (TPR) repeat protein
MEETDLHDRALETNLKADAEWLVGSPVKKFARRLVTHWISAAFLIGLFIAVFVYVIHFVQREGDLSAGKKVSDLVEVLARNWVQVTFVWAVAIVAYVQIRFGIDYFEKYRNASTKKELSKFYGEMGDRMMDIQEWDAAKVAYDRALDINPQNDSAALGSFKAKVFDPLPGQKTWIPEVVDARLKYLSCRAPDDYQLDFLKGLRNQDMWEYGKAAECFNKALAKNTEFSGGYVALGNLARLRSDLPEARLQYQKAVDHNPSSAAAKNSLGACLMLLSKFPEATKQFVESYQISPTALIASALGESYWFSGSFRDALDSHQQAVDFLNENPDVQNRYTSGGWRAAFCPLADGDIETPKRIVQLVSVEEKRAVLHFQLAIDHALLNNFVDANTEFEVALKFQPSTGIHQFIQNRMEALGNRVQMSDSSKTWLAKHRDMLG